MGVPDKAQPLSFTSSHLDSAPAAIASSVSSHQYCLNRDNTGDSQDAMNCQMMCFSSCSTALIFDPSFSDQTAKPTQIIYRGTSSYSFLSLSGPPETQPPQLSI